MKGDRMYIEIEEMVPCDDSMTDGGQWSSTWKGAIAGAAGGLVASWVMNQFQSGVAKLSEEFAHDGDVKSNSFGDEETAVKTAEAISGAAGHQLTQQEKQVAGPAVHYAF